MSVTSLNIHERFKALSGREMTADENSQLRDILAQAPDGMAQSPSFIFRLLVDLLAVNRLDNTIQGARKTINDSVEIDSGPALDRLLQKAIKKVHESSPSTQQAYYKACLSGAAIFLTAFAFAWIGLLIFHATGVVRPLWFSEESFAKIHFAEEVEQAVGGSVDWSRRQAPLDESLVAVVNFASARGTNADPYHLLRLYESCKYPGQESYRSRGELMCRYDAMSD
ncbi:hypothetical protein WJT74_06395 [Sphingomicrobium sp. XHP0239]|uniref:hypothetical protein n=1 Tax=Sphingomicrobium maritimum TaxID=3133972 RepID=UPI0031CCD44B